MSSPSPLLSTGFKLSQVTRAPPLLHSCPGCPQVSTFLQPYSYSSIPRDVSGRRRSRCLGRCPCLSLQVQRAAVYLRPESRALWGWLRATSEQVKQLSRLSTRPHRTPGLWGSGEGTQGRLPCPAPALTPSQVFWWAAQLSPRSDAFRAAHTPPCWWQRAGRSHSLPHPSLHPPPACSKFWR